MMSDMVILVDEEDNAIGEMDKLDAHEQGKLHRAFSIFIMNSKGEMLVHRRAMEKYHSGGLWTNACCSHPRPGETIGEAANRRLNEEMGITTPLEHLFQFTYHAKFENGLVEHELDHVLIGHTDQDPKPAPSEVMEYRWISLEELVYDLNEHPDNFTIWFRIALRQVLELVETKTAS